MADWLDVWSILGKEQGLELDILEPVRMTVGGVKDPQKLSNLIPVMWVSSGLMDQGELEIHKRFSWATCSKNRWPSSCLTKCLTRQAERNAQAAKEQVHHERLEQKR
jgi:hypothetical protein